MKRLAFALFCLAAVGLLLSTIAVCAKAGDVLKFSSPYAETNPMTSSMQWFGKELEKRTNGRYQAHFFFSGSMGKAPDMPDLCKNGVVDFIFSGLGYTPHIFKLSRGFELMYITENPHASGAALWDMYNNYAPLREEWERQGLMMVFPAGVDIMACQSKEPVRSYEDIRGKKIRSYAAVADMIKTWGGSPIALSYAEIYDALNRGVLDAAFGIPTLNVYASRFWEVAPYIFNPGVGVYAVTYFAMSKETYDNFPEDVKAIVEELREEGMARHRQWMVETEKEVFKQIHGEKSIQIINWTAEEKARAKKLSVPQIWENWLQEMRKEGLPGEELLEKYKALAHKYEEVYPYTDPFTY
jgi:TRAP-type C4-dicarboxylate transport system substrate-binding protein